MKCRTRGGAGRIEEQGCPRRLNSLSSPDTKLNMKATLLLAVLATATLTGCVAAIGNRDTGRTRGVTLGQELIDLQKARDSGALTPAEYETQKARLMGKMN